MGKFYKMVIDPDDNIHVIINKKGYGKDQRDYNEKKKEESIIKNCLLQAILKELDTYGICVDERVTGIEVLNAVKNIVYNYMYK